MLKRYAWLLILGLIGVCGPDAFGEPANVSHAFRYVPAAGAATVAVSVAGDFNGWSAATNPMPRGSDGAYSATVNMPPGKHAYRIVYDGKWINDPAADKSLEQDDGFGGKNSVFIAENSATPSAPAAPSVTTHTFHFLSIGSSTAASVAGDINGWNAASDPMHRDADGSYSLTLAVTPGLHHYKIVSDGKWIADPSNHDTALETDDGNGGKNSGFVADIGGATPTHTFFYIPPTGTATVPVSVAADFNGWSSAPNPLPRGADGVYSATIPVPAGTHHYKIVYDGKWIADPANHDSALETDDGRGGKNSGFTTSSVSPAPTTGKN